MKFRDHEEKVKPDVFAPAAIEAWGFMGSELRNVLRIIAEVTTYQSSMDLNLSVMQHKFLIGGFMNQFYNDISVKLQKVMAIQLRSGKDMVLNMEAKKVTSGHSRQRIHAILGNKAHTMNLISTS